ncbi:MAG: cob(I)yrinic acid a,c-diamide adenosyltransferase [Verrucomicrobiota bacterium]|nr:cob(I)yrinic acid a,c-diamide adenosyltransferase [Verrucomicrobiota bacterium]
MSIVTRGGDRGSTSLFSGERVPKSDLRIRTGGALDLLNCQLGLVVSSPFPECGTTVESKSLVPILDIMVTHIMNQVQPALFDLGAVISTTPGSAPSFKIPELAPEAVATLEDLIFKAEAGVPKMRQFIMPRGNLMTAQAHVARGVCRQCESYMVELLQSQPGFGDVLNRPVQYINRLSDFCFILARVASNIEEWDSESKWFPRKRE